MSADPSVQPPHDEISEEKLEKISGGRAVPPVEINTNRTANHLPNPSPPPVPAPPSVPVSDRVPVPVPGGAPQRRG